MKQTSVDSPVFRTWRRFKKNRAAVVALVVLILMILVALFAPLISPSNPTVQILEYSVKPALFRGSVILKHNPVRPDKPTLIAAENIEVRGDVVHYTDPAGSPYSIPASYLWGKTQDEWHRQPLFILGTDRFGRDLFSRLIYGMRVSLSVGVISQFIALTIGVFLGALSGYFRGWVDDAIMWLVNVVWSFPGILLVIAFSVILGHGYIQTFIAIGISSWVEIARIVRGQFLSLREQEYIEAARAFGFGHIRTMSRHMLPNAMGPVTVLATAGFATAIIAEASLSFIGLGIQPPDPSWGQMIRDGYGYIAVGSNWGMTIYPCIAIGVAVFTINILGDGLRDALDPRTAQR